MKHINNANLHQTAMGKKQGKKKKRFKKKPVKRKPRDIVRPTSVEKPNHTHMPVCTSLRCNRRVSDARKSQCSHCSRKTVSQYNQYNQYNIYD